MIRQNPEPIFYQIKEKIKDDILAGVYQPHELILSTNQIAKLFSVNPATAVKSVSMLQNEGIVYKKRGIGMCVSEHAKAQILQERTDQFYQQVLVQTIAEAKKIGLSKSELLRIIQEVPEDD